MPRVQRMMEADNEDLPQEALQTYLSTVLSGITAVGGEPVALDLFFENGARTRDCKVFRDVDSVLVITQCFPWKECYDILTNPTHVGPLGPLHIKVKFSHTDEAAPTEEYAQYGDLPDDEPQTSSQIFTDVINEAFQLIGVSQNGVTPWTLLTKEQRMWLGRILWSPAVPRGKNEADARRLYKYCQDQFQELCWFPSIVTDKVYDYRAKSGQGWTSFGDLVGKARAISIGWNRKKRSLHAVTTGEPRDPVLDEEAVCKWREANPVEDEGMVDIVQQRLVPWRKGWHSAPNSSYSGAVFNSRLSEVIKDFQEEESSDIEMKEEDEGSLDGGM
ncbi:hypothetical protein DFH08DRAFT_825632 [Mycena albidolilacea]|uniref:Uncharacterized protein n=1 Tax=Mycena albidolilacea TaxID=1033008 RepID=A0AAD7E8Y8_9AGAR|nr:hypothetical protein DFH08DRAFT_825632 [Mycena albidolilacea]